MRESTSFQALVDDWLAAYGNLMAALEALPPEQRERPGLCGTWSARQLVAHLAGWHYEAVRRYAEITAGDPFDKTYDAEAFNALQVEAREHLTWQQTLEDLREVMDILHTQARDLPERLAAAEPRYAEWLDGLARDAREHLDQVRSWLPPNSP
jgi:uncharacterized protein (TIGR03083 family)